VRTACVRYEGGVAGFRIQKPCWLTLQKSTGGLIGR